MKILNLAFTVMIGSLSLSAFGSRSLAQFRQTSRIDHARELMGTRYKKSVVSRVESRKDVEKNVYAVVKRRLPKAYKGQAYTIAQTVIDQAAKNSLDPYFVMAVISGESSFNPLAVGPVGEIGLMQIRLGTGEWMSGITKTKWRGEKTLRDPVANIKLGIAYLAWLRNKFEGHGQLYLAAYNMGPKSVKEAVSRKVYPKDYPIHVMKRYIAFYKDMGKKKSTL
jgi:soluble lytic murein transglycosylase